MELKNGKIMEGDKQVGTAVKSFKFGYHPAVLVEVGTNREWFELDEPELINKIIDYAIDKEGN